jgi:hypothetical protein
MTGILAEGSDLTDDDRSRRAVERFLASVEELHDIEAKSPAKARKMALQSISDLLDRQPAEWLVKGTLPRRGVAALFGASGTGKTFAAVDLAFAVAAGRPWFDYRVTAAPVVYLCLEGSAGFAQRVKAYTQNSAVEGDILFFDGDFLLTRQADVDALVAAINRAGMTGAVIVIDTFAAATAGLDENSGSEMGAALSACKRLAAGVDGLVLLIHHTGKDQTRGLRGHSSMLAALDAAIEVNGGQDGEPHTWTARKVKDGQAGRPHHFDLRQVFLGRDSDGDEITSCIVIPSEPRAEAVGQKALTGKARIAVFKTLQAEAVPMAKDELAKRLVAAGINRTSVYRAITELTEMGLIVEALHKVTIPEPPEQDAGLSPLSLP